MILIYGAALFLFIIGFMVWGMRGALALSGGFLCLIVVGAIYWSETSATPRNDAPSGKLVCREVWLGEEKGNRYILMDVTNSMISRPYIRNGEHVPC